jgi:hypothetical protein
LGLEQQRSAIVKAGEYDGTGCTCTAGGSVSNAGGADIQLTHGLAVVRQESAATGEVGDGIAVTGASTDNTRWCARRRRSGFATASLGTTLSPRPGYSETVAANASRRLPV